MLDMQNNNVGGDQKPFRGGNGMKSLFEPFSLGHLTLKNRFVRSATRDGYADDWGHATEELVSIYEELAKGGVGLIITGHAYITDIEQSRQSGQMGIYSSSCVDGYSRLTEAVRAHGAKILMQISCNRRPDFFEW
jgi:2,4-dienoyl-CoA reductase-like NADH-dependent reductase (Old Yellow Enzyme family)